MEIIIIQWGWKTLASSLSDAQLFSHHFRPWGCKQSSLLLWNKLTASGISAGWVTKPFQDLLGGKSGYSWAHAWCPWLLTCSSFLVVSYLLALPWCLWFYFLVSIKVDCKNGWKRKMLFIDVTFMICCYVVKKRKSIWPTYETGQSSC